MPPLPPITQALLLINVAAFFLDQALGGALTSSLILWPAGSGMFRPWQPVSYAFAHASLAHLLVNMLGLWMFGGDLEERLGQRRYMAFYAICALSGAVLHLLLAPMLGNASAILGASGAVLGLVVGYAMLNPHRRVMLLIPPIPMKARTMAILYAVIEVWSLLPAMVPGVGVLDYLFGNVAHLAHLGGMLGAVLAIRYWQGRTPFRRR
ncbi:MAG: rhomboid family intramembrane serine protease [Pseudomonadota bacterium]|nr:rhomboid family intramembrane serine protease [Pseudomonadota bacterium]